jgi:aryl-alcohol dehydrogenase-like predicted oxidoreductase
MTMEKRRLGSSDLDITVLGYGAWAIGGGDWEFGWGAQDDTDSIKSIHEALDLGVNWIDTAAIYGLGRSEEVVAQALHSWKGARPYVFTKCSLTWDDKREIGHSLKSDSIKREIDASLKRLHVDTIDLYQVHWPNPDDEIEEGWAELALQVKAGKLRNIGVSNFNVSQMKRAQAIAPIASLQPPYHMLNRGIEAEILPYCAAQNIGVIVYSPMASGLLTGAMTRERIAAFPNDDWRRDSDNFKEPKLTKNLALVELLRKIGAAHGGKSPGEIATAWTLRHPAITGAIVGLRKPGQAAGSLGASGFKLRDAELAEIEAFLAS